MQNFVNGMNHILKGKGNSAFNGELNSSILMEATDWPDKLGNETDAGTFAGHFYDPDTGKNWLGQKSPTARTRAESYFQAAVNGCTIGYVKPRKRHPLCIGLKRTASCIELDSDKQQSFRF